MQGMQTQQRHGQKPCCCANVQYDILRKLREHHKSDGCSLTHAQYCAKLSLKMEDETEAAIRWADKELEAAIRWADKKAAIERTLGGLSGEDQRRMLTELLMARRLTSPSQKQQRSSLANVEPMPARDRIATNDDPPVRKTDLLVDFLRTNPDAKIPQITKSLYGTDDDERMKSKVRSMLTSLKKQGRVKRGSKVGRWKAT